MHNEVGSAVLSGMGLRPSLLARPLLLRLPSPDLPRASSGSRRGRDDLPVVNQRAEAWLLVPVSMTTPAPPLLPSSGAFCLL